MLLTTLNQPKQLLLLSFIGEVRAAELAQGRPDLISFLAELSAGFRLVTDLTHVELIDTDCLELIVQSMKLCNEKGVGLLVRVIPDPAKDIGLNILSAFHYPPSQRIVTCASMVEAAKVLSL
jgi:anti-anti-sigma regulatory factor